MSPASISKKSPQVDPCQQVFLAMRDKMPQEIQTNVYRELDYERLSSAEQSYRLGSVQNSRNPVPNQPELWNHLAQPLTKALGATIRRPLVPFGQLLNSGITQEELDAMSLSQRRAGAEVLEESCSQTLLYQQLKPNWEGTKATVVILFGQAINLVDTLTNNPYSETIYMSIRSKIEEVRKYKGLIKKFDAERGTSNSDVFDQAITSIYDKVSVIRDRIGFMYDLGENPTNPNIPIRLNFE